MTTTADPLIISRTAPVVSRSQPRAALDKARRGDRQAFSRLMEPYRRELVAYCYRLTRSLPEAEDLAQEAFVRAFRALDSFEGRATPRAWLYKIAHNLCLNHVQRRPPPWESLDGLDEAHQPLSASSVEAQGQGHEDVRLGFVALMQSLPARQRAALVLRDVLGWSAEEAARILETTVPAVKNALARARQTLAEHPRGGGPEDVREHARTPQAQAVIAEWVDAFEKGNTARMVALLTGGDASPKPPLKAAQSGYIKAKETVNRTDKRNDNAPGKQRGRVQDEQKKERTNGE